MPKAILFGAIGTIVETSELQREAFNRAFAEAGLAWDWTPEVYAELLEQSGGRERIEDEARRQNMHVDAEQLHARKTQIFHGLLKEARPRARPNVPAVIAAAGRSGVKLGFATGTDRDTVKAVLAAVEDEIPNGVFAFVGDRSQAQYGKPAPDIYLAALDALGVAPGHAVAIEDSPTGADAARAADIPVIAFPGAMHEARRFGDVLMTRTRLSPADLGLSESFDAANTTDARPLPADTHQRPGP